MQRVLTTLGHQEPDRVPLFLLLTMHGARELGLSIREYFSRGEHVAEGQLRMRAKYGHDCLYGFFYAPVETEAWGGEVLYREDGPPNAGAPFLHNKEDIRQLQAPRIEATPCLAKVLQAIAIMKARSGDDAPIIAVVMSPFSLPVMQLGFERYLELLFAEPDLCARLLQVNAEFCVAWANAQLQAGATAICYFDPVSSPTIVTPEMYRRISFPLTVKTLARIKGPTATHFASGNCLPIIAEVMQTGTAVVGVSEREDLTALKEASRGRLTLLGNLNGIEMRHWTPAAAAARVKEIIGIAAPGGGFILSDQHGEIPWQVPEDTLHAVVAAVERYGTYPELTRR